MEYLGRTDFVHLKPKTVDEDRNSGASGPAPFGPEQSFLITAPPKEKSLDQYTETSSLPSSAKTMDAALAELMGDAPPGDQCGPTTVRNGTCYKCINCGNSMGCS